VESSGVGEDRVGFVSTVTAVFHISKGFSASLVGSSGWQ
jgi:hypothetical protein